MHHVMISDNNVIICKNGQVKDHKNVGYKIRSGSSFEKTTIEMAKRLTEEVVMRKPSGFFYIRLYLATRKIIR